MNFKTLLPHLVAVAIFFLTAVLVFAPRFQGKTIRQGDIIAYQGASKEMKQYEQELDRPVLWTGTSFSGMPTYQISVITSGNTLEYLLSFFRGFLNGMPGVLFAGLLCAYLMLLIVGVNPWLSIAGAIGIALASNNLILWKAGHLTKVATIYYLPLVAAGIIAAFQRKYLLGGLVFALGMGMAIFSNHPQMILYFGLTVPIFGIVKLVQAFRTKDFVHFGKAIGALVVGLLIAVGAGASNILPTQEYADTTMRGGQVLETPTNSSVGGAAQGSGLDFEYAMNWSNGFKDMVATYVPNAAGGGTGQEVESSSELGKAMRKAGFNIRKSFAAPLYHGSLPFTEAPIYLGAVAWALFIFALFTARRGVAIWLGGGALLIALMSAGSNIEGFNRFLFDNVPLLSKFRTPNSALGVSAMLMIALGIIGVYDFTKTLAVNPAKARKQLLYAGITAGALGAFIAILLPAFLDFNGLNDMGTLQRFTGGQVDVAPLIDGLIETRKAAYSSDAWRSLLFVGLSFGTLFLLFRGTIKPLLAGLIIAALFATDFTGITGRYITKKDWVRKTASVMEQQPTAADQQILQDPDPHYRVLNLSVNTFNDASTSYFHKSVGGYSAVKMRRYQDLIDGYISQQNRGVINMLNTKYYIVPGQDQQPTAQRNPEAFGAAWLVSNINLVNSNDAEFAALGTTDDLKSTAIVHQEFSDKVSGFTPSGEGTIKIDKYLPDELTYSFNSSGEQLAVFSEIWYGPDLGWKAYIDGTEAELIRANYLLRAVRVPAGQHEIKLVFEPSSYALGKTISLICSLLIILGLVGYLAYRYLASRRVENTAVPVEDMS